VIAGELEQEIIGLYNSNICAMYSINQISKKLKKKYPYIHKKVRMLIKEKILLSNVIGRAHLCSLNLENERTVILLTMNELEKRDQLFNEKKGLHLFLEKIKKLSRNETINSVVWYNKRICCIVESSYNRKLKRIITNCANKTGYKALCYDKKGFIKEVLANKKLFHERVVIYGFERFFELMLQAETRLKARYNPILALGEAHE